MRGCQSEEQTFYCGSRWQAQWKIEILNGRKGTNIIGTCMAMCLAWLYILNCSGHVFGMKIRMVMHGFIFCWLTSFCQQLAESCISKYTLFFRIKDTIFCCTNFVVQAMVLVWSKIEFGCVSSSTRTRLLLYMSPVVSVCSTCHIRQNIWAKEVKFNWNFSASTLQSSKLSESI